MDPMGFGTLAHAALSLLPSLAACDDEEKIQARLLADLDQRARRQFGAHPPLAVAVQLDSLRQRLRAAAAVHAGSVRDGWRIQAAEQAFEGELDGMRLRARLDRIERHADDGRIRILDYKTTDAGKTPAETHYQPRNRAWTDLQLPLYRWLYEQTHPGARVATGYFTLPKAARDSRIIEWNIETSGGESLYPAALDAAREVVAGVRAGRFWPPANVRPDYDNYALLFAGDPPLIEEPAP
jgi:ATP-dependent helicase/nuclease subunit B